MRQFIGTDLGSYTFNAAAKTVTLNGLNPLTLEQILLITNVTDNKIIYQFNSPGYGGTIAGNIITLQYDTTTMSNTDNLQVVIDYETQPLPSGSNNIGSVSIIGTLPISGSIDVNNFPLVQSVSVINSLSIAFLPSITGTVSVDNFPPTQVISGSVAVINGLSISSIPSITGTVSVSSLPSTPAGTNLIGSVASIQDGTWNINNITGTVSLPTGAATAANQTTGNSSLSSIDSKTPSLGPALEANSVPVVLPAAQIATLTPLSTVTVTQATGTNLHAVIDSGNITVSGTVSVASIPSITGTVAVSNFPATQPVSGTVTADAGTGNFTVVQTTGTNLHTVVDSGTITANAGTGTFAVSAASLPLPTGASTAAKQPALGTAGTPSVDVITVQGITSMTALKVDGSATTQPVSGTVTANQGGTWNINNISGTVSLPTGAATETTLSTLNGKVPSGLTVTSTRLLTDGSGVTQPISAASLPLPTGAATSALQTTGNTSLSTIATNTTGMVVTQGSTTSGQSGQLIQGAVTTTHPTYTTAQTSPLSLTVDGALRTRDIKDEARNVTTFYSAGYTISSATDSLLSLTGYKNGAAVVATTTPAVVTSGKTFRITGIMITQVAVAAAGTLRFTLRANTGGVVAIGSPAVQSMWAGTPNSTAGVAQTYTVPIPDGLEFAAGTGIGVSLQGFNATGAAAATGYGMVVINGYEY